MQHFLDGSLTRKGVLRKSPLWYQRKPAALGFPCFNSFLLFGHGDHPARGISTRPVA
jgi:hypothetical protein